VYYDPRDDSLRFANGAVVPDDAAIWAELERRGLVREPTAAVPGRHARHLDIEAVRADLLATALPTAQPAHHTACTSSGDAMTSIDTTLLTWHAGHIPGTRHADLGRYRIVEVHAGRCYVIEQLGDDGLLTASFAETATTLTRALELVEQHRAGTLPAITYEEWATGHLERYTSERAALGEDATPADRHWYDRNIRYMQDTIRRHKELTAAGHLWCVTTGTGQHLVVPHGPRDNGGFGPVNVWTGWGFGSVRFRDRTHPSGCLHQH
jgi:hypothetical protein